MTQLTHSNRTLLIVLENVKNGCGNFLKEMKLIQQKRKTRQQLIALPEHLYSDIGMTHDQIQYEINKSYYIVK